MKSRLSSSHAAAFPLQGVVVDLLLLLALIFLWLGLNMPLVTVEKFYFFENTVSLISALQQLWHEGERGLAMLIGGFSVLIPVLKLLILAWIWNFEDRESPRHARHLHWLEQYGKWSMLDVFVVAVLVVSIKLGVIVHAVIEWGLYAFAASVLLSLGLSVWIGRQTRLAKM